MLQHLLVRKAMTSRLTAGIGGERSLTNYLHLAELLEESPAGQHGAAALLRWLQHQMDNPDAGSEGQLIRLENDEQLIRIVTVHRSKGLNSRWSLRPCSGMAGRWPRMSRCSSTVATMVNSASIGAAARRTPPSGRGGALGRGVAPALCGADPGQMLLFPELGSGERPGADRPGLSAAWGRRPQDEAELRLDMEQLNRVQPLVEVRSFPAAFPCHRLSAREQQGQLAAISLQRPHPSRLDHDQLFAAEQ